MTSPKSLQNNFGYAYRTGLRDNALFAAINAVLMFFCFCLTPIMVFRQKTSLNEQTGQLTKINFKEQYSFLFSADMAFSRYLAIAALLGIGLLMGIATFRFITGKKTVNVYYSLGIKRTRLFTAKYLSGLTLVGLSVLVPMLVALFINLAVLGANKYLFTSFFYLLIGMFSLVAFSYTLTATVFATVGTAFEGVLFSGILLLLPQMLLTSLQVFIQNLVLGTPLGSDFVPASNYVGETLQVTLAKKYASFNPLRYISNGLYTYSQGSAGGKLQDIDHGGKTISWVTPDFLVPIIWLLVTAALFALGVFFYERRKAEIGGFIGKNKVLNFIGIFLVGIYGFAMAYDLLRTKGTAIALLVGAVAFVVIYAVLSLLLLRNFKQFVKDLPALGVQLVLLVLIFAFFFTGYFGVANKIPETADVASVKISMPFSDYQSTTPNTNVYFISGITSSNPLPVGNYTSEKDIEFVRGIHKQLVEAGRTEATPLSENFNGIYPICVRIAYTLKSGKEVLRNYYGVSEEIVTALQQRDKTEYRQSELNKIFKDPLKPVERPKTTANFNGRVVDADWQAYREYLYLQAVRESEDIRLYNKTMTTETVMELTAEQRQTLRDCLYADLSAQTAENHYNPENTLGVITFGLLVSEEPEDGQTLVWQEGVTGVYTGEESVTDEVVITDGKETEKFEFAGKELFQNLPDFCITSDMTKTVEFLKSVGYFDEMCTDRTLQAIYGVKVAERFRHDYIADRIKGGMNFGCEFLATSSLTDNYAEFTGNRESISAADKPIVYKTTDAAQMQAIYQNTVTRAKLNPNDYIVILEYSDGMHAKTYVHADKMPESAKAEIEKNKTSESFYW